MLCNLVLDGLEQALEATFGPKHSSKAKRAKVNLVRFADDFLISRALLEEECLPLVEAFLQTRGLELSREKTRIVHIEEGFDFLGQNLRKYGGKLLIRPSKKNVKAFMRKVRGIIKAHPQVHTGNLIALLNPLICGWTNYHRHVVSKQTFA